MAELDKGVVDELKAAFNETCSKDVPDNSRTTKAICLALAEIRDELRNSNKLLVRIADSSEMAEMQG